ncbi:MAG: acetoacetate--CoA ligase, partial [Gammaproteobacteria bacterium]|nr:acetoacetate--CoA ligase [Gammaproteobacteria bacterium]
YDLREIANALLDRIPSLEQIVSVPFAELSLADTHSDKICDWSDFISDKTELQFTPVPFDHPLFIMFSSGTTGKPKCIVHGVGGTLLQHLKELMLHTDLSTDDNLCYLTTCGWMMWNWMVSGLATGATLVLYDGAPFQDASGANSNAIWNLCEQENVTVFGSSAKFITAVEKAGSKPAENFQLEKLRCILSTGSPLMPENFDFVYQHIKTNVQLASISGGTDIVSCFALGNPNLPVYRGELQCIGLGMDVKVFNDAGQPVNNEKGELVCTSPFPCMPVKFWNDPDGSKYHAAYFERFPGIWHHGDYAEVTDHHGLIIHGRSDATLNPGGVRIGTAEIYAQVETLDDIIECAAVAKEIENDIEIWLLVVLRDNKTLDDSLKQTILQAIKSNLTPRHVPAAIVAVPDLPRTRSGKLSEIAIREALNQRPIKNTDALANPETIESIRATAA